MLSRQAPALGFGLLLWTAILALACAAEDQHGAPLPVEPPSVDLSTMESPVAAKIETARNEVRQQPTAAERWGRLGMIFHAHTLYSQAIASYRTAEQLAPADYRWSYLAAVALVGSDRAAAVDFFERAARLSPREPAFWIAFGDALTELGRLDAGAARYTQALELDAQSTHALVGLARLAVAGDDLTTALEHLEKAAGIASHHGEVHALLAQVAFRLGDVERARREELLAVFYPDPTRAPDPVVAAMEEEAVSSRAYTERGLSLVKDGRLNEAEAAFRQVLAIRPGNARDHANLGGALARQGRLDEAVASYEEALRLEPEDPWTLNNLALALVDLDDLEAAAKRLEQALQHDPTYAEAYHSLGLVRGRQGRLDEAIAAYRSALDSNPAMVNAHTNLGTALAQQGRLAKAIQHWRQALEIDRRDLAALYNLSAALIRQRQHSEAIGLLRTGLTHAPNSSRFASLLAWELATAPQDELRNGEEAVVLARRLREAYPDDISSTDVLAAALAEAGRFEEAERLAGRALELVRAKGDPAAGADIFARLQSYRKRRAFHQPSVGSAN